MAEYIEREAAIALYEDDAVDMSVLKVPVPVIIQNLKDIPAADVMPVVRGKWLEYDDTEYFRAKCSLCGNWIDTRCGTNFCPNCGARMDGDGDV